MGKITSNRKNIYQDDYMNQKISETWENNLCWILKEKENKTNNKHIKEKTNKQIQRFEQMI